MHKYEIMLIIDPNSEINFINELVNSTFKENKNAKIEKMERNELAYEINKSKIATYVLINIEAIGTEINEFIRKCNINKKIWRVMSINLSTEKGLNRKVKSNKFKFKKRHNNLNQNKDKDQNTINNNENNEDKVALKNSEEIVKKETTKKESLTKSSSTKKTTTKKTSSKE